MELYQKEKSMPRAKRGEYSEFANVLRRNYHTRTQN